MRSVGDAYGNQDSCAFAHCDIHSSFHEQPILPLKDLYDFK